MYHWRQFSIQQTLRSASLMALLVFGTSASAQVNTSSPIADDTGVATLDQESFSGGVSLRGTYFDVRHQTNSGVGYRGGFTQFGVFAPIWASEDSFIAPNVRLTLTDDAATGFNAGLVARRYVDRYDRIFGVNAFYDDDISSNKFRYQQFGFGAETLGRFFDARANGYVPTTRDDNFVAATGLSTNLVFFENRLGFIGTQLVERSLAGGDAEVGAPLGPDLQWLRAYVGAYAYRQHDGSTPVGYRARVEGWLSNDLSVGAMITSDDTFGTNVNFTADWRFAGLRPTRFLPNWSTRDRMMMPVNRQWRVSTSVNEELVNVAGENPRDGQQYFVVWVDPDATAVDPGTGTFEDPFHTLPGGVPNETDLVMVRRGDTTEATPLDGTITLPDFARMLGEGKTHLADVSLTTGPFSQFLPIVNMGPNNLPLPGVNDAALPGAEFTNTNLYPFLTNSGGNIINVGNHNEVAAFVLENAAGAAIAGNNTSGFHFNHLEINGNLGGIVLTNAHGTGSVTPDGQVIDSGLITDINRNLVPDWSFVGTGLGNNGIPGGISIATGVAPLDLTLARISMNSEPGLQDYGVRLLTEQGRLTATLQDVSASGGNVVAGVSIEQKLGQINATIDTLDASDNLGVGLQLLSGNLRPMTVNGTNVTANGNAGDNLLINDNPAIGAPHNSTFTASFTDSTFDNSTGGNGISLGMTNGIKSLTLTNVSASANALMGLDLQATGGTLNFTADGLTAVENNDTNLNIGLTNANFVGNVTSVAGPSLFNDSLTGSGIVLSATGGQASLNLDTIFADGNAVNGVDITALGGAQIGNSANAVFDGVNIHDSSLSGNGGIGLNQFADGASHLEVFVDPTDISGNGLHNVRFEVLGGSTFAALYDQTTMENSGTGNGLLGLVDGTGSVANVLVRDSLITGSADDGVYLGTTDNGLANVTLTNVLVQDSGASTAGASGIELNGASGSTLNLVLNGNVNGTTDVNNSVIGGPADFGLSVLSEGTGTNVNVTATNTNFDNAATDAVNVFASTNGTVTFNFTGTRAADGGADGLNAFVQSGGTFNACLEDTRFERMGSAGMRFVTTGANSITNVHMEDGAADDNDGGGLVADILNGGEMNMRTVSSTFDGNGVITDPTDGVFVNVADAGSTGRFLFNTTSASDNLGDATPGTDHGNGFKFVASNGAYLTARLDSITANDNAGGYGVRLDASGAGTDAVLIPEGTNTITGNTLGSYSINYTGTNSAIVGLTGSFNNQPTDGVSVNITGVGTALVTLTGDGTDTISGNGDNGVEINIDTTDVVGIRIAGYSDISNNVADGIHIELTDITTSAAIEVLGPTDLTNNGDDGVDILLTNVVLGTFVPPAGLDPLSVLTLTDNLNAPLDCLPLPVDVPFDSVVTVPTANGILLDQLTIARNGGVPVAGQNGIDIVGDSVTGLGEILIGANGNTSTITNYDNGINAAFTNGSSFGGITIDGATIDQSDTSGIAISYDASGAPITVNNTTIRNSGTNGLDVVLTGATGGFDINLAAVNVFDSGLTGTGHGVSITDAGAASTIGDIIMDHVSSNGTSNGGNGVQIVFDTVGTSVGALNLTSVSATNSDAHGILIGLSDVSVGSPIALDGGSDSFATNNGLGGAGDGIRITLNNLATAPDVSVTNYDLDGVLFGIDNNAGNGIAVISSGTTDVGAITVSNNRINDSTLGDGIRVELVNNVNGDVTLDANVVNNSSGDGIRLALDGVNGQNVSTTNSNIDGSGAIGINLTAVGATLGTITLDPSTVNDSQFDGVRVDLTNAIVDAVVVQDFTITDSSRAGDGAGSGLNVILDGASVPVVTIDNVSVSNVAVAELMDRGVSISGIGSAGNPLNIGNVTLTDVTSLGGTVNEGVAVVFSADSVANGGVQSLTMTNVSADSSGTTGILVDLNTITVGSPISLTGGPASFSTNNGGDGIRVSLDTVSGTPDVNISDYNQVDNNGGNGILLQTIVTDVGAVTVSDNTVSNSLGGDGIQVSISGGSALDSLTMNGNNVSDSSGGGISVQLVGVTAGPPVPMVPTVRISNSNVTNSNGGDGVQLLTVFSTLNDILIDNVSVSNSNNNGVAVLDFLSTINSVTLNQVNSTAALPSTQGTTLGTGVTVQLNGTNLISGVELTGPGTVADSALDGISVILNGVTGTPYVTVEGYTVDRSGNRGIAVETNGSAVGAVNVSNFAVTDSGSVTNNEAQGVLIDLTNSDVSAVVVSSTTTNTIDNSAGRGFDLVLDGVSLINSINISDLDVTNSGTGVADGGSMGRGVSVAGVGSAGNQMLLGTNAVTGLINLTNVTSTDTGIEEGVAVDLSADAVANGKVGNITLTNVSSFNSAGVGILTSLNTMTFDPTITIDGSGTAQSNGNGVGGSGDGILVTVNNVVAVPTDLDIIVSNYLLIDTNAGHGIAIETNGNAVGNISVTDNQEINNSTAGDGIHLDLSGSNISGNIEVSNNLAITNTTAGDGIQIDLTNSNVLGDILVSSNTNIDSSSANGVNLLLDGVTGAPVIDINNTTVTNSGARGVSVTGSGATLGDVLLSFVSSDTTTALTGDEGVALVLDNGTVGSILFNGVSASNSNLDGVLIDLDTMTVGPQVVIDGQGVGQITGNGGNGILVNLDTTNLTTLAINSNTIDTNTLSGVLISQLDSNVGPIDLTTNTISNNSLHGVNFTVANSAQGTVTFTENQITGQTGGDGVHVVNPDDTDGVLSFNFLRNTISNNTGGRGVNFTLPNPLGISDTLNLSFTNDTIDSNGLEGLLVDLTSNATTNVTANIEIHADAGTANSGSGAFASSFSGNTGMGVFLNGNRGLVTNTADFNLTIDGNLGSDVNAFNGNGDAGLGIHLAGGDAVTIGATATIDVTNGTFNNNVNGTNTNFAGAGIGVLIENNSRFDNSTIDGVTMNGNATNGFSLNTSSIAKSNNLQILDSTVTGNTGSGLLFNRNAAVPVAATYISNVLIDGNTIQTNRSGVDITAAFASGADTYTISNNDISDNTRSGIRLFITADADLNVDIDTNTITGNGTANVAGDREGIVGTENLGATDIGVMQVEVQSNTIDSNRGAGLNITALHNLNIHDNEITNNTLDGLTITGATVTLGGLPIVNNTIAQNAINDNGGNGITLNSIGRLGANITDNNSLFFGGQGGINRNGGDGVQLNAVSGIIVATLDENDILNSTGDGIQFLASGTGTNVTNVVTITDNIVTESGLRGINILNAADTRTTITINDNLIDNSQREGVYIVNTSTSGTTGVGSATVQGIDALADTTMAVAATHTNDPRMALNINDNVITSNGQNANNANLYDATGLVLRVGSSNALNNPANINDNGGFASALTSAGIAGGVAASDLSRGGVAANVTGNIFGGQFGSDVTFQAYVSTTAPTTTAGQWTDNNDNPINNGNDQFNVTTFMQDPLSRLDLRFNSNTGSSIIATRSDVFATGTNSAFYNNDESVFKSRTLGQDGNDRGVTGSGTNDDGGPFTSGVRRRNAVRRASIAGFGSPNGVGTIVDVAANGFLYPGVDQSTFRRSTDSDIGANNTFGLNLGGTNFGANVVLGGATGEADFVWSSLP